MRNLKLFFGLFFVITLLSGTLFSQDAISLGGPGISFMVGDSCAGPGSLKYDDGGFENGYGWSATVTDGRTVQKFRPLTYPWNFTKYCVAVTRTSGGADQFLVDVVVYDTSGAGGAPGATPVFTLAAQTITGIPIYPLYAWFNFAIAPAALTGGAYYIGLKYNPAGANQSSKFLMADQGPSTPLWSAYGWANAGPWTPMNTYFPTFRAMGMRTEGNGGGPSLCAFNTTLCRNGLNVVVPDNNPNAGARDTIKHLGNTNCVVCDINVKIDTVVMTWDSDLSFTLNHNATTVALITNRGGSGDNFIGTILNDSAANPISSGTPPFTGSFRPEQPLSAFNTTHSPQGNWVLYITDNAAGDIATLRAWCITFTYSCPTGGIETVEIPNTYRLSQNYPNPFNPVTTIKYGLPKYGDTKLVVYNITGQVVSTLVNEFKDSGTYEVQFDATNLSSGVYFYTLESGSYKETKKMLLVK